MPADSFYPLLLKPIVKEKIWGGRNLERFLNKPLPPGERIGETWECWDGCAIENGAARGITLRQLLDHDFKNIIGSSARANQFPLLFKFIDAQDDLSVQVHPDDAAARAMENQPLGKTEAWYIIHAEPDARLIHGFEKDVDAQMIQDALNRNTLDDLLCKIPVESGDVVFVPAGTVHAIMRGIVLAEIQENSDITYRLYDWGRTGKGRDLHIADSLRVAHLNSLPGHKILPLTIRHDDFDQNFLVACRYFALESLNVRTPVKNFLQNDKFNILSIIRGEATISYGSGSRLDAKTGQTLLLPARLVSFGIEPTQSPCKILRAYVPDLRADVIEPLVRAGNDAEDIALLGGASPAHNDLKPIFP